MHCAPAPGGLWCRFASTKPSVSAADLIVEVNSTNFQAEVVKSAVPVILDCYADWCGPCQKLTPMLEKAVRAAGGKVRLAKLNIDAEPQLSQALRVTSVPAVFALHQGKLLTNFTGLIPEAQLQQFVKQVASAAGPAPEAGAGEGEEEEDAKQLLERGFALLQDRNDSHGARDAFQRAWTNSSQVAAKKKAEQERAKELARQGKAPHPRVVSFHEEEKQAAVATAGLVRCAIADGDLEAAQELVKKLKSDYPAFMNHDTVRQAVSMVDLAGTDGGASDTEISRARATLTRNDHDLQARLDLAKALMSRGQYSEGVEHCLQVVRKNPSFNNFEARDLLLTTFSALGPEHPLAQSGRARLANLLYR